MPQDQIILVNIKNENDKHFITDVSCSFGNPSAIVKTDITLLNFTNLYDFDENDISNNKTIFANLSGNSITKNSSTSPDKVKNATDIKFIFHENNHITLEYFSK